VNQSEVAAGLGCGVEFPMVFSLFFFFSKEDGEESVVGAYAAVGRAILF